MNAFSGYIVFAGKQVRHRLNNTATHKTRAVLLPGIILSVLAIFAAPQAQAATSLRVSQRIYPITCTLTAVSTGTSIVLQPSGECGEPIIPEPSLVPPTSPVAADKPSLALPLPQAEPPFVVRAGSASKIDQGGGVTVADPCVGTTQAQIDGKASSYQKPYINDYLSVWSARGVSLITCEGAMYTFRLSQDTKLRSVRGMQVVSVGRHGMTIRFSPGQELALLTPDKKVPVDLDYDTRPDIWFVLEQSNSNQPGLLRVGLIKQEATLVDGVRQVGVGSMVVLTALIMVFIGTVHVYHRIRVEKPERWHTGF